MSIQSVLLPVLVQVGLIFVLFGVMSASRMRAFKGGLDPQSIAVSKAGYPAAAQRYAACFSNQFEIPVLFLFAVIFGIVLHQTGWLFVLLEWVFVAFRVAHAVVHTTSNVVKIRGPLFFGSVLAAALMWLSIFFGVYFGSY